MTKDKVPVIYHDFTVSQRRHAKPCPVYELTLSEFLEAGTFKNKQEEENTEIICEPFCTLASILSEIDPIIGLNIELKYPTTEELLSEGLKRENFPELNDYLDSILNIVVSESSSKSRKILWTSFHPDICVALKVKQVMHPVGFLTYLKDDPTAIDPEAVPINSKAQRKDLWDPRVTTTLHGAIAFSTIEQFEVIVFDASSLLEVILIDPELLTELKAKFKLFSYGAENSEKSVALRQIQGGLSGLITDDILALL